MINSCWTAGIQSRRMTLPREVSCQHQAAQAEESTNASSVILSMRRTFSQHANASVEQSPPGTALNILKICRRETEDMNSAYLIQLLLLHAVAHSVNGAPSRGANPADDGKTHTRNRRSLDFDLYEFDKEATPPRCSVCAAGVNLIRHYIAEGRTAPQIVEQMTELCIGFKYRPPTVCRQLFATIGPEIVDIVRSVTLKPLQVCSFVFNVECGNGDVPGHRWRVPLPNVPKPPVTPKRPPQATTPKLRVLHISDTHYDPMYHVGSRDICDLPMCCREANGIAAKNESGAGRWGGWKCDIPERTLDAMLDHIAATHRVDYIVWTGDIPPHASWSQTAEESLFMLESTSKKIRERFPGTPVFPALGNHEPTPPHNFPPPSIGRQDTITWFYEALAAEWQRFLPDTSMDTVRRAGYYIAPVRPGLKIISLNTNFCYYNNWWLIVNSTDPADQLEWFAQQLQTAETSGDKIHVIAHIPPGYFDCLKIWSSNYYRIISRYENTVTAQFFGHTHTDEVEIYYDEEDTLRPAVVGYVAPAASTHIYMNPGYRVYTLDGEHNETEWLVADFETWVMNLTESNRRDRPVWYKMFTAREAYNLTSLLPDDWNRFYDRVKTDDALLDTYDRHYWKDSPLRPKCGAECRTTRLCDIRSCVHYGQPLMSDTENQIAAASG